MARSTLVLDASVGVKWFSPKDELALSQALAIRDAHNSKATTVVVPDLFYYEVTNAVVHKESFSADMVQAVVSALFGLGLRTIHVDHRFLANAADYSRQFDITIYDSVYLAIARSLNSPLVTANPRHQRITGAHVIPLAEWKPGLV